MSRQLWGIISAMNPDQIIMGTSIKRMEDLIDPQKYMAEAGKATCRYYNTRQQTSMQAKTLYAEDLITENDNLKKVPAEFQGVNQKTWRELISTTLPRNIQKSHNVSAIVSFTKENEQIS